jgi:predicted RNA-binding Zn ribbon-like protein
MPLLLVQAFVNTYEAETDIDLLRDPETARSWLAEAELLPAGETLDPEDLRVARQVREGLRTLLIANAGHAAGAQGLDALTSLAERGRPRIRVGPEGRVRLDVEPGHGIDGGLMRLLIIVRDAQVDGTWVRLKACGNDECRWAFYDRSHSRRGRWCDMAGCGNRMKNRSLRARRRRPA